MKKTIFLLLISAFLLSGCSGNNPENNPSAINPVTPNQQEINQPSGENNAPDESVPPAAEVFPAEEPLETLGPDCYGEDAHPIGSSIASQFPDLTEYEEVMVWFCNGFEFEDILTALQTSQETGIPPGELLETFANGLTWEAIWIELGMVEP
jgi:hypothetical protein